MGNVNPNNTSALMVLQSASEVPLENTRAGLYEWLEDIGAILLDMMGTYYGTRPVLARDEEEKGAELYDFSKFKDLWLRIRVDVGPSTRFSEIAMTQTLDNLRQSGALDIIQYLERVPDRLIPRKAELIEELKAQAELPKAQKTKELPAGGKLSAVHNLYSFELKKASAGKISCCDVLCQLAVRTCSRTERKLQLAVKECERLLFLRDIRCVHAEHTALFLILCADPGQKLRKRNAFHDITHRESLLQVISRNDADYYFLIIRNESLDLAKFYHIAVIFSIKKTPGACKSMVY
jgi:hypothetical protein